MKQINNKVLDNLALQVEFHLQLAIKHYQNLPEQKLMQQPKPNSWSATQCLWHLNSYASFYYPLIENCINKTTTNAAFKPGWLGNYFVGMMNKLNSNYKASKQHIPLSNTNAHQTLATFINHQETLIIFLRQLEQSDLNQRLPTSISRFIKLKLGDILTFIIAHNNRHLLQANAALGVKL